MKSIEKYIEYIKNIQLKQTDFTNTLANTNKTVEDIGNIFANNKNKITGINIECFKLHNYKIVSGNLITGMQIIENNKPYYIMLGANSLYSKPYQIAIGTTDGMNIYMIREFIPNNQSTELISISTKIVNQNKKELVSKKSLKLDTIVDSNVELTEEMLKAVEHCLESSNILCSIINQTEDKRKKLTL